MDKASGESKRKRQLSKQVLGAIPEKGDGVQDVANDERLEHVQLKVTVAAAHCHRDLVAHHLRAHHPIRTCEHCKRQFQCVQQKRRTSELHIGWD